jgi:hypothetical protein
MVGRTGAAAGRISLVFFTCSPFWGVVGEPNTIGRKKAKNSIEVTFAPIEANHREDLRRSAIAAASFRTLSTVLGDTGAPIFSVITEIV